MGEANEGNRGREGGGREQLNEGSKGWGGVGEGLRYRDEWQGEA